MTKIKTIARKKKTTIFSEVEGLTVPISKMRRFHLVRHEDETGISGTGIVAEGVVFTDGTCVIKWLTDVSSVGIYKSYVEMIHLHGHGNKTTIDWIDEKELI